MEEIINTVPEVLNLEEVWVPKQFMTCNDETCPVVMYNPATTKLPTHCPHCGGLGHSLGEE